MYDKYTTTHLVRGPPSQKSAPDSPVIPLILHQLTKITEIIPPLPGL
jgi:hypothetical protein